MPVLNKKLTNTLRNPFVALCEYASKGNWCWNIVCTTCGHSAFKVSFSKIVRGLHPDDESFWPNGRENDSLLNEMNEYNDFIRNTNIQTQKKLAAIVAEAKLSDIKVVAKFPEWLGYIGLVLYHCPNYDSQKIISDSFLPQFINLVKDDTEICNYLKDKQVIHELLDINDLSRIEQIRFDLK